MENLKSSGENDLIGKKVRGFKFEPYKYGDLSYPEDSMDRYVGKIGVIKEYGADKDRVRVQFDYDSWWYPLAEIEQHLVEVEKTYPVTRKQLSEIYGSVCDKWKSEINTIIDKGGRFSESFEVPQSLIWRARAEANDNQTEWLDKVFDEVKKEIQIGKWYLIDCEGYYSSTARNAIVYDNGEDYSYGFNFEGKFVNEFNLGHGRKDVIREATSQEVEQALIEEAKKRGFVRGVNFTSLIYDKPQATLSSDILDWEVIGEEWHLRDSDGESIFHNGKWAEVIKQDKIEVGDWAYLEEHGFKKVKEESQAKALSKKGWSKVTDKQVLELLNNYELD